MTKQLLDSLVCLHRDEAGQGLIEYVLILALIAFGAVLAMKNLATAISSAFSKVGSMLTSSLS
jgi:pilus assembly protein Flp/PilA